MGTNSVPGKAREHTPSLYQAETHEHRASLCDTDVPSAPPGGAEVELAAAAEGEAVAHPEREGVTFAAESAGDAIETTIENGAPPTMSPGRTRGKSFVDSTGEYLSRMPINSADLSHPLAIGRERLISVTELITQNRSRKSHIAHSTRSRCQSHAPSTTADTTPASCASVEPTQVAANRTTVSPVRQLCQNRIWTLVVATVCALFFVVTGMLRPAAIDLTAATLYHFIAPSSCASFGSLLLVTGVQFWVTSYFTEVIHTPKAQVVPHCIHATLATHTRPVLSFPFRPFPSQHGPSQCRWFSLSPSSPSPLLSSESSSVAQLVSPHGHPTRSPTQPPMLQASCIVALTG